MPRKRIGLRSRELCFERVENGFFLSCVVHVGLWSCFGMLSCLGMCDGDGEPSSPGKAEELTHSLRAVRGLPSPGSGTGTDPFVLDLNTSKPRNPIDPEGIFENEPVVGEPSSGSHKKPRTDKGQQPPGDP